MSVCGRTGTIVGRRRDCYWRVRGSDYCQVKWQQRRWGNFFRRSRSLQEQLTPLTPRSLGHCKAVFSLYVLVSITHGRVLLLFRLIVWLGTLFEWLVATLHCSRNLADVHVAPGIFSWSVVCTWEYHFKHMEYSKMNASSRIWKGFCCIACRDNLKVHVKLKKTSKNFTMWVGPCHHGMALPQVADGGTKRRGISWLAAKPVSFSRGTLLHGVSK
jgi:hypothetical protein